MNTGNQKRRHYLIAYRFQLRFALYILALLIFTSMVIGWTVYYSAWHASEDQLQLLIAGERITQADALQIREAIRSALGDKVFFRLSLLIFIAFVFTVFATHRMVGPIRHIEKTLQSRLRGDPVKPIHLRKTDEFQNLAKLINRVLVAEQEASGGRNQGSGPDTQKDRE